MTGEVDKLKAMRGIAALIVAFLHGRETSWIGIQQYWATFRMAPRFESIFAYGSFPFLWGPIGVPVFFVISGYCIHYSYSLKLVDNPKLEFNWTDFLKRRFIRIYPVLIGALLVTLALDSWSRGIIPNSDKLRDVGAESFFVNLFAMQGILGEPYGSNFALWTLALEIQFYAAYPLLIYARQRTSLRTITIAIVVISVLSWYFIGRQHIVIFTSYYASWFAGAFIAELHARKTSNTKPGSGLLLTITLVFLAAGCYIFLKNAFFAFQLWAVSFAFFFWFSFRIRFVTWLKPFEWIGEFSYSLYIVHMPFFVLINSVLFHSVRQQSIWYAILFELLLIPFSYGFYRVFEKPFADFLDRKRRKPVVVTNPAL